MSVAEAVNSANAGNATTTASNSTHVINYQLSIINGDKAFLIDPLDGNVNLSRVIGVVPAKLQFKVVKTGDLDFKEGNRVKFSVNDEVVFNGYVFEKEHDKDNIYDVIAYDQLRYFKNHDCYVYKNWTATVLIANICKDLGLTTGDLANTVYTIPKRIEKNKTYSDIIQWALDQTLIYTGKLYQVFDVDGKIRIAYLDEMKLNSVIDAETMENYRYNTSIDRDTYNTVKVIKQLQGDANGTKDTKLFNAYSVHDPDTVEEWGVLQTVIEAGDKLDNIAANAQKVLSLKDRKTRRLSFSNVIGDVDARGGSLIYVSLGVGDIVLKQFMLVHSVTHKFTQNCHLMDITVDYFERPDTVSWKVVDKTKELGELIKTQAANTNTIKGIQAGYSAWAGKTMPSGPSGCVEAVTRIGSYYSPLLQGEYDKGVAGIDTLCSDAGESNIIPFSSGALETGDTIIYDDRDHVVLYDGSGGYYGNSSSANDYQGEVVHGGNYYEMNGMEPTEIIKTSRC